MRAYVRHPVLAGLGLALVVALSGAQSAPPVRAVAGAAEPETAAGPAPGGTRAESFTSSRTYPKVALPKRVRIPALRVESRLDDLGVRTDGTVEVPESADRAGWFSGGPRPGQDGPAVILGHVDSRAGPGVFGDLVTLEPGTLVHVDRADGTTATFRVTRLERVPKARFPTDPVYAPSLDPTLRLVTCGGTFDPARGSYRDNVIAFADLV